MKAQKPVCQALLPWLRSNLGDRCTAPLTGTDARALAAAVHIAELYSYHREPEVLRAFGLIVSCMQEHTQELASHAIALIMDWSDREPTWLAAGLPAFTPLKCAFEPGGSGRDESVGHSGAHAQSK